MNTNVDQCVDFYQKLFERVFIKPALTTLNTKFDKNRVRRQIEELGDVAAEFLARILENKPLSSKQSTDLVASFQKALKKQDRTSFPSPSAIPEAVAREILVKHKLPETIVSEGQESSFRLAFVSVTRVLILTASTLAEWEKVGFPREFEKLKTLTTTIRKWAESLESMSAKPNQTRDTSFEHTYRNELLQRAYRVDVGALRVGPSQPVDIRDLFVRPKLTQRCATPIDASHEISNSTHLLNLNFLSLEEARKSIQEGAKQGDEKMQVAHLDAIEFLQSHPHVVIVGVPGGGKSTLVEWLQVMLAAGELECSGDGDPAPVPLLLRVRQFPDGNPPSIDELVTSSMHSGDWASEVPTGWTKRYLELGRILLIVDGLDETTPENRNERLLPWLQELVESYSKVSIVLTLRPAGYPHGWLAKHGFVECDLAPFDDQQSLEFAQHWHTAKMMSENKSTEESQREGQAAGKALYDSFVAHPHVRDLAKSPLMLAAICLVHHFEGGRLPDDRALLYKLCVEGMLHNWDQRRGIQSDFPLEEKLRVCRQLAIQMQLQATAEATLEDVQACFAIELGNSTRAMELLENMRQRAGVLIERRTDVFAFAHLTFQEYLAAVAIHNGGEKIPKPIEIARKYDDARWREVIPLYCGVATRNEAGVFLRALAIQPKRDLLGSILCDSYGTAAREVGRDWELHDLVARAVFTCGVEFPAPRLEVFDSIRLGPIARQLLNSKLSDYLLGIHWLMENPAEMDWHLVERKLALLNDSSILQRTLFLSLTALSAPLTCKSLWNEFKRSVDAMVSSPSNQFDVSRIAGVLTYRIDDEFNLPFEMLGTAISDVRKSIFESILNFWSRQESYSLLMPECQAFAKLVVRASDPDSNSLIELALEAFTRQNNIYMSIHEKRSDEVSELVDYLRDQFQRRGKRSRNRPGRRTMKTKKEQQ